MLNELNLLSQNISRLIEISNLYQQDLHQLKQKFTQTCTTLEQVRSERDALKVECDLLRTDRDRLAKKIEDAQEQLKAILERLLCGKSDKSIDHQLALPPPSNEGNTVKRRKAGAKTE